MERVFLSRRNLLILLSKLDRQAAGEETKCTVIKNDNTHHKYPQTMESIEVVAVEDEEYYTTRSAGGMHPSDEATISDPRTNPARVMKVRELTDAPMMECKKALYMHDGNIDKAVEHLMSYRPLTKLITPANRGF